MQRKMLIISPYPVNTVPGQRLKYEQYFKDWEKAGYTLTIRSFFSEESNKILYTKGNFFKKVRGTLSGYWNRIKLLNEIKNYDIVYSFLWVTPFGPPLFERLVRNRAKALIYDIDDLVFLSSDKTSNKGVSVLKGHGKSIYLMKVADYVITCTPYLDKFVRQFNDQTIDISSTVDTKSRYQVVNNYSNDKPLVIGWSGSHSTVKHLLTIQNVIKTIHQKYPTVRFLFMGSDDINIEGVPIESMAWKEAIEIPTIQKFDIGIYPLPNEQWVFGKSGLKAIQYMAMGIPTIATAIGTNFRVIEDGVSGYLVDSEEEWINRLSMLIEDANLRRSLGTNGRLKVEKEFSLHANLPNYLHAFDKAIENSRKKK